MQGKVHNINKTIFIHKCIKDRTKDLWLYESGHGIISYKINQKEMKSK